MPVGSISAKVDKQVQTAAHAALNLLFPLRCAGCGTPGSDLCATCTASMVAVGRVVCKRCGEPLRAPGLCSRCKTGTYSFRQVRSAFRFEGILRTAVHALKYERRRSVAAPLARAMSEALERPESPDIMLCAVPLHPTRLSERGYNQSAELAQHLAQLWGISFLPDDVLERIRPTERQVGLDYAARQKNVDSAFRAGNRMPVSGKVIVLVDDVCTTTATLNACATALLEAGASAVDGVTLARQV
jgi:ComF family protein